MGKWGLNSRVRGREVRGRVPGFWTQAHPAHGNGFGPRVAGELGLGVPLALQAFLLAFTADLRHLLRQ